jgi:hypothetical protein
MNLPYIAVLYHRYSFLTCTIVSAASDAKHHIGSLIASLDDKEDGKDFTT